MKKRWISLLLALTVALAAFSAAAAAADAQKAEDTAAADTEQTQAASQEELAADNETAAAEKDENAEADSESADTAEDVAEPEPDDADAQQEQHIHAVNREDECEIPSFEPLDTTGGKLASGCYYLTQDVVLDQPLCVGKNGENVTICLNGYTLSLDEDAEGCVIYVAVSDKDAEPSTLTITDCNGSGKSSNYYVNETGELVFDDDSYEWQERYIAAAEKSALQGGRITGATAGAVCVGDYNRLYLYQVNIIDNAGRYGAGVIVAANADAVLDSCTIAGNTLTGEMQASERQIAGGGVYCAGTLEVSGTTVIHGNRADGEANNLYLDESAQLKIASLGIEKQARIGISTAQDGAFLTGYADDFSDCFTSDDPTLAVQASRENGFTDLTLQDAVYTLTLAVGESDEDAVTVEAKQGQSLEDLHVHDPQKDGYSFAGWVTQEHQAVDAAEPLHLMEDTTLYAEWTQEEQTVKADALQYDPDAPVTREQAVKTLYQMAKQMGMDTAENDEVDITEFSDTDGLDAQTQEAVRWAYAKDLLSAKDGTLRLQEELSKKDLSRMLEDFYDLLAGAED